MIYDDSQPVFIPVILDYSLYLEFKSICTSHGVKPEYLISSVVRSFCKEYREVFPDG